MLKLNHINYSVGNQQILHDISFEVAAGEIMVLSGESGSGKSSILNVISGLIPGLYGGQLSGTVDSDFQRATSEDYVRAFGIVFQNPKSQFINPDVYSELAFAMENVGLKPEEMRRRINEVTDDFGTQTLIKQRMFALSGGQRQLVAMMSASMLRPPLYLLDEPSSNLDADSIQLLRKQLLTLKRQGKTVIVAEHRLHYLKDVADHLIVIQDGRVQAQITHQELQDHEQQIAVQYQLRNLNEPQLKLTEPALKRTDENLIALSVNQLKFGYRHRSNLINIDQLSVTNRDVIGIAGDNGAGKSTLIQLITGIAKPQSGTISINGQRLSRKQLIQNSFLVNQDVHLQLFFETVAKEVENGQPLTPAAERVLKLLQIDELLDRHPQTLSGGEQQRVAIATALLSHKRIIVLDEPTSGMDFTNMQRLSNLIGELKTADILLIIVSHDLEFLNMTCSRVVTVEHGKII